VSDALLILFDAATDAAPTPFSVNNALRDAGIADLRVRELLDHKLHVFDHTTPGQRVVTPLTDYVATREHLL
jgi:hypothetical protein